MTYLNEFATPTNSHGMILNIEQSAYFFYINTSLFGFFLIHEVTMVPIFVNSAPGYIPLTCVMILGTQNLIISSYDWPNFIIEGFILSDIVSCHSTCKSCAGITTEVGCTACNSPKFLNEGQCGLECPAGKFKNYGTNTCDLCDPSCATCTDGGFNGCVTCISSRFYNGDG